MAKYTGAPVTVGTPQQELYHRISNLTYLKDRLDQLPADMLEKVGSVDFINDNAFAIEAPGLGRVQFDIVNRTEPTSVTFAANAGPVPLNLVIELAAQGDNATSISSAIDVEIPMMLRPLVGSKMQEAADRFSQMIADLNS
jgi:carbon monoxide dehydrogenase subunit G